MQSGKGSREAGKGQAVSDDRSVESIEFAVAGDTIRGRFYLPGTGDGPWPVVVLAHGWAMNAGGDLEDYAAAFVARGCAALTFDFRRLGRSDGLPRQEIDPWAQIEDFRAAISYVRRRAEVRADKVGIWGSSYSGGHVLVVAALDRRVACVVSQVPTTDGHAAGQRRAGAAQLRQRLQDDREQRDAGLPPGEIGLIDPDGSAPVAYPGRDSYEYMSAEARRCPAWENRVTLRSLELARAYLPGAYIRRIAPTPLLMIVADDDVLTPTDLQQHSYQQAFEPKSLLQLPGGHYSVYQEHFATTSQAAADWFEQHLK